MKKISALTLMASLAACSSSDDGNDLASCIAPVQMDVGESVEYEVTLPTTTLLVQLEQSAESEIALTRTQGQQVTEINLQLNTSGTCPEYLSDSPLYASEHYLLGGEKPFSTAINGELIAVDADDSDGDSGADSTATEMASAEVNCTDAPPNTTCEASVVVDSQSYGWAETKVVDGAKPASGVNSLLITRDQVSLLDIQVVEWNGL